MTCEHRRPKLSIQFFCPSVIEFGRGVIDSIFAVTGASDQLDRTEKTPPLTEMFSRCLETGSIIVVRSNRHTKSRSLA